MKILWYPKLWRELYEKPQSVFITSNRIRTYNMHAVIKDMPNVQSDIIGLKEKLENPFKYDIVVFQKYYPSLLAWLLRLAGVLVVWDVCDPIELNARKAKMIDLIITSSHGLATLLRPQSPGIPVEAVVDAHEAYPLWGVKEHTEKERLRVTWYGTQSSGDVCLMPIKPAFDGLEWLDFHFASTPHPPWAKDDGFHNNLEFHHDWREAGNYSNSWQRFIFESDVGIVPIFNDTKSPHKILNYMAYGIPVVCSPNDGHSRIIQHGVNGFFAESPSEWVKYLSALRDPALRQKIGLKGLQTATQYSVEVVARRYYDRLIFWRQKKKSWLRVVIPNLN